MSKTASAYGKLSRARFAYRPVLGDLKSGLPAEVDTPAPVRTTIRGAFPSLISSATDLTLRDLRVLGGTLSSINSWEDSWPILNQSRDLEAPECLQRRRRPIASVLEADGRQ